MNQFSLQILPVLSFAFGDTTPALVGQQRAFAFSSVMATRVGWWTGSKWASMIYMNKVEVDFGSVPLASKTFTVSDSDLVATTIVTAGMLASAAPTGKDIDELEMDTLIVKCATPVAGTCQMTITSTDGSYLEGKFVIWYQATG